MVICEITGKETNKPVKIRVGGAILTVDISQKHMGTPVDDAPARSHTFKRRTKSQTVEEVVPNFQSLVNKELAKRDLNLHQLARMLNLKESTLNKMFSGKIKPDVATAKKLGSFFDTSLVEEKESGSFDYSDLMDDSESSGTTLGDLIKKQL